MQFTARTDDHPGQIGDSNWRPMQYWNLYRFLIASLLFGSHFATGESDWWQHYDSPIYFKLSITYLLFSMAMTAMTSIQRPSFKHQVLFQAIGDIGFIVSLMHVAGGVKSGLGILLVIAIVGAAMVSQGRLALFFAAVASIALLLEQSVQLLVAGDRYEDYSQPVMLSLSCFATAWLAYALAKRMQQSEALASQRGVDLENLSQVNQLIIQDMQDGVLVIDEDLMIRHHNTRAEVLLGLVPGTGDEVTLQQAAPEVATQLSNWIKSGQENRADVTRIICHGTELRLRFQQIGTDRRHGAVIFVEDWSRVQAQARQLKLAALGGLTANIAHEIRNPLSAISHASQLLQEEEGQPPIFHRLLSIIDDNTQRLDKIVQDVMQLNRRDRMQQESIHLATFLEEFREQFCQNEKIRNNGIHLSMTEPSAEALFDRHQLHQVLWNLCRNGWRHGQQQEGSLTIRLGKAVRQGEVMLEITDDGPGVPEEVRPRLFEPFFTTEKTGTGLGLYIARELCEANNAGLRYVETPIGAQFRIYLKNQYA